MSLHSDSSLYIYIYIRILNLIKFNLSFNNPKKYLLIPNFNSNHFNFS